MQATRKRRLITALYSRGLTIYSTQDKSMQKTVDSMMNNKKYYPANSRYELTYQLIVTHKDGTQITYSFSDMKKWFKNRKKKVISGLYKKKSTARKQIKQFRAAMLTKNDTVQSETIDLVIEPQSSFVVIDQAYRRRKSTCRRPRRQKRKPHSEPCNGFGAPARLNL